MATKEEKDKYKMPQNNGEAAIDMPETNAVQPQSAPTQSSGMPSDAAQPQSAEGAQANTQAQTTVVPVAPARQAVGNSVDKDLAAARAGAEVGAMVEANRLADWNRYLANGGKTDAELAAENEARQRSRKSALYGAIGDGLAALGNLYFTTQYAPNVEYRKSGMVADAINDRWDKAKAEWDKNKQLNLNQFINAQKIKNDEKRMALQERLAAENRAREDARDKQKQKNWEAEQQAKKDQWQEQMDFRRMQLASKEQLEVMKDRTRRALKMLYSGNVPKDANGGYSLDLGDGGVERYSKLGEWGKRVFAWAEKLGISTKETLEKRYHDDEYKIAVSELAGKVENEIERRDKAKRQQGGGQGAGQQGKYKQTSNLKW